ncbi:MAG: hypothetical protein IIY21_06720 [Clostridiales bacterium]|nr:hypothetical protein [Clostridiales bacterium]MBQ1574439.1 hypothetical protein [Clostridiales bacterium]
MKRYYASIEAPDDLKPRYGKESVDFFFTGEDGDPEIITTEMVEDEWHSLDEPPKEGEYVLISFENYGLPDIGRMEDGVFYPGDETKSYKSYGLIVNGWRPLPRCKEAEHD